MEISVKHNIDQARRELDIVRREQIPFATARALTLTAKEDVKPAIVKEMKRVFDRPTPWTLNSLYVSSATKSRLMAQVYVKDEGESQSHQYLRPEIAGGPRRFKRLEALLYVKGILKKNEFVVPGVGARLDVFGNMSRGQVSQIISALKIALDPNQNRSDSKRSQSNARNAQYFVPRTGSRLPRAVYQRFGFAIGSAIKPVLVFVKQPKYRPRLDYYGIGERTARKWFPIRFDESMQVALATARK
jgi:hypothetical protein